MALQKDLAVAVEIKRRLEGRIPVREVRLFGSRARGEVDESSDLDLYVETEPLTREQRRLISDVAWEVGFERDVVVAPLVLDRGEAEEEAFRASSLFKAIKEEGVPV